MASIAFDYCELINSRTGTFVFLFLRNLKLECLEMAFELNFHFICSIFAKDHNIRHPLSEGKQSRGFFHWILGDSDISLQQHYTRKVLASLSGSGTIANEKSVL